LTLFPLAVRAERERRWKIAAQHLSKLVAGRPSNAALVRRLAWARASEGNWAAAIKENRRAIRLVENDLNAYYFLAIAQLAADDMTGYQKTRNEILKRWVKPRRRAAAARVVYASIYGRDATAKEEKLLLTLAKRSGQNRLLAAIYVRTKKYDQAIELLKKERRAWDRMFLTLAYIRSNKKKEAQQTFKEVQAFLKNKKDSDWVDWHERAEVYAMVREAAKLLKP